jgi:hypothetical protein
VQSSAGLGKWNNVSTNTAGIGGNWQFTDKMDSPAKFYRLRTQ